MDHLLFCPDCGQQRVCKKIPEGVSCTKCGKVIVPAEEVRVYRAGAD